MEVYQTEKFYIFVKKENSLWWNRKTSEFTIKAGWDLSSVDDIECIGITSGIIGVISLPGVYEPHLIIIKEAQPIGALYPPNLVYKIKSICILSDDEPDTVLFPCPRHSASINRPTAFVQQTSPTKSSAQLAQPTQTQSKSRLFEGSQIMNKAIWGAVKSAGSTIKNTTQHAAVIASNQVRSTVVGGVSGGVGGGGGGGGGGNCGVISGIGSVGSVGSGTGTANKDPTTKIEKRITEELHKIFDDSDSFYYCPDGDITNNLQRRNAGGSDANNEATDKYDERFFWNMHMLKDIFQLNDKSWILPIIQGFVQIENCVIGNECFTLTLVSRRSRYRAGTRYKRRGVDVNGNCANYVETEQILSFRQHQMSFTQVRGSVPIFWSQPGYKYRPPPRLDKDESDTQLAFEKHFNNELDIYKSVCIVNLVEQCGKEKLIYDSYGNHIINYNNERLIYVTFDFHEYCRGMRFENVSMLIEAIAPEAGAMGFHWQDSRGTICQQKSVFRVNCMDCLDRTNVVQTAMGKAVLESQLVKLGLAPPYSPIPDQLKVPFMILWANNGDIISRQYAGTNALKGDYTRTGERKFAGLVKDGMNSANRYFIQVFNDDKYRQCVIDMQQGNTTQASVELNLKGPPIDLGFFNNPIDTLLSIIFDTVRNFRPAIMAAPSSASSSSTVVSTTAAAAAKSTLSSAPSVRNTRNVIGLGIIGSEIRLVEDLLFSMTRHCEQRARSIQCLFTYFSYYLARFKDAYRQATIDLMLGNHVSQESLQALVGGSSSSGSGGVGNSGNSVGVAGAGVSGSGGNAQTIVAADETDVLEGAEHARLLVEDCRRLLLGASQYPIGAWGLIDADPNTGDPNETEVDSILLLTDEFYMVAEYDSHLDKIIRFEKVPLINVTQIEYGPYQYTKIFQGFVGPAQLCIRLNYTLAGVDGYFHMFRSPNIRFFNNVAIVIKTQEEVSESLLAIIEFFRIALENRGRTDVDFISDVQLQRRKSRTPMLDVPKGMPRNLSESQLLQIGSKALSNVAGQFSKLGQSLNPTKIRSKSNNKQSNHIYSSATITTNILDGVEIANDAKLVEFSIGDGGSGSGSIDGVDKASFRKLNKKNNSESDDDDDDDENDCSIYEPDDLIQENPIFNENSFLPSVGIVMSSSNETDQQKQQPHNLLPSLLIDSNNAAAQKRSEDMCTVSISSVTDHVNMPAGILENITPIRARSPAPEIRVDREVPSGDDLVSSSNNGKECSFNQTTGAIQFEEVSLVGGSANVSRSQSMNRDLSLNLSGSQSENALKQLKTLTSPLSKLAKGMQSIGMNLDPRKITNKSVTTPTNDEFIGSGGGGADSESQKLHDKWDASKCKTKLIAL